MPSFDIVSEVDMQEVDNAVNGVEREVKQRYDFKGSDSSIERSEQEITLNTDDDYKLGAMGDMLKVYFTRRDIDAKALNFNEPEKASGNRLRQKINVKHGIDQENAKKITKAVKESKIKVQAAIRGNELRVTGKKRDDLQNVISIVKEMNLDLPLQYINFRD